MLAVIAGFGKRSVCCEEIEIRLKIGLPFLFV
jgi:hypothetical protein